MILSQSFLHFGTLYQSSSFTVLAAESHFTYLFEFLGGTSSQHRPKDIDCWSAWLYQTKTRFSRLRRKRAERSGNTGGFRDFQALSEQAKEAQICWLGLTASSPLISRGLKRLDWRSASDRTGSHKAAGNGRGGSGTAG